MGSLKTLRTYQSLLEAEGARSYLEAHGVEAELRDRHSLYQQPHLIGVLGGARLQVPEHQFQQAEDLLAAVERRSHLTSVEIPQTAEESSQGFQRQRQRQAFKWLTRLVVIFIFVYWAFQYIGLN